MSCSSALSLSVGLLQSRSAVGKEDETKVLAPDLIRIPIGGGEEAKTRVILMTRLTNGRRCHSPGVRPLLKEVGWKLGPLAQ
jgi:hypothetical protein